MAFRSMTQHLTKHLRSLSTSTTPKLKPATINLHADTSTSTHSHRPKLRGEFVPVYVAVGLVALATAFGAHTAKQQLLHAPNVSVRKRRRETLPEVVEPEQVLDEAEEFVKKSFFRKIAHLQDPKFDYVVKDKTRGGETDVDTFGMMIHHAETLKSVGVEPSLPNVYPK